MKVLIAVLILNLTLFVALTGPARADTPLAPPADFSRTADGVTLTGSVAANSTRVTTSAGSWVIPRWLRFAYPSADGQAVLGLTDSGNLIGTRAPDQIVLTLYRAANPEPLTATLGVLMDPDDMPQTVSHFAWMDGLIWESDGWTLTLTDGGVIRINPVTGVFTRQ